MGNMIKLLLALIGMIVGAAGMYLCFYVVVKVISGELQLKNVIVEWKQNIENVRDKLIEHQKQKKRYDP